jgi:hypothetical protein
MRGLDFDVGVELGGVRHFLPKSEESEREGYLKEGVGALSSSSCGCCSVSINGWAWREIPSFFSSVRYRTEC